MLNYLDSILIPFVGQANNTYELVTFVLFFLTKLENCSYVLEFTGV